jgi:hypothetical protein
MSRNRIFVLTYYRHKLVDLICDGIFLFWVQQHKWCVLVMGYMQPSFPMPITNETKFLEHASL